MPEDHPYRLSIAPELEAFRPELEYACGALDASHFVRRVESAETILHYGPNPPKGAIATPAVLFPHAVRLDDKGIHPKHDVLAAIAAGDGQGPLLPPCGSETEPAGKLRYDALGLIVAMLSRLEERGSGTVDRYGRFAFDSHMAVRSDRYAEPVVDRATQDLAAAILGAAAPASRTRFEILLTHDVDSLRGFHRPLQPLRYAAGDIVKRRRFGDGLRRLRDAYLGGEPWTSVRWLMDLSERYGRQSRFYFMGPTGLDMDSPYALSMKPLLRQVTDAIVSRGHVVGFHPGFGTATNAAAWKRQRNGLEEAIGRPVLEGRQHVLGYAADATPEIWADSGMEMDSTLAFPEASGFRTGSCRPHHAYSLRRRRRLDLVQHSTAIMEFGLFGGKYRDLTIDQALNECQRVAATTRAFGGTLVVLYHTGQTRPPLSQFYQRLLDCLH